jgi:hypothetical protein
MAKKLSVADIKAGRIHRCENCDAKCDDEYSTAKYKSWDICLGRVDDSKKTFCYFCSSSCQDYNYMETITPNIKKTIKYFTPILEEVIDAYRIALERDDHPKRMLLFVKTLKSIINFYQGCLDKKGEYALHELRCKATKYIGDFMEEHHDDNSFIDFALKSHKLMNDINIEVFN